MEEAEANYLKSNNTTYQSILKKAYHESHKQSHKKRCREQAKQRYNRKKALEKQSERIMCDFCGYDVAREYFHRHLKTQRHKNNFKKKNETELGYDGSDEEPCKV